MPRSVGTLLIVCFALVYAACVEPELAATTASQDAPPMSSSEPTVTSTTEEPEAVTTTTGSAPRSHAALDVPYNHDHDRQVLDVHTPAGSGPFPTILAVHGGRFQLNSKNFYRLYSEYFPSKGIAFVPTNYRLVPGATYPAQVEDVHCALAWIHANADEYDLDPERVIVLGGSAGGHLAAMLGTVDQRELYAGNCPNSLPASPIAGAVIFYGFFDFNTIDDYPPSNYGAFNMYWGATYEELEPEQLAEMSPISWIDGSEPPFLLIHGTRDTSIPSVMSERFVAALEDAGASGELVLVDSGHGFENYPLNFPEQEESLASIEELIANLP